MNIILILDPKHGNIQATRKKTKSISDEIRIESECGLSYRTGKTGKIWDRYFFSVSEGMICMKPMKYSTWALLASKLEILGSLSVSVEVSIYF